jgi:hypothetical protein
MREVARVIARSRGEHRGAAPELRAAVAHKGVVPVADRSSEVSHSLMVARKRTMAARPCVVVDRSRKAGHSRAAAHERTAVAHSRVVAPRTRVRMATCKCTALAYSRAVADRTAEVGHNRVAADKRAAASRNHVAIPCGDPKPYSSGS